MAKPDLSGLSVKELEAVIGQAQAALAEKRAQEAAALADELRSRAEAAGLDIDQVLANLTGKKRRAPAKAKYRHPSNTKLSWSGRGKKPKWLTELLEQGKSLKSLEV